MVRFVARLRPVLSEADVEDLMRRLSASLSQQTVGIRNIEHPAGKKFPKLRGGTEESTLKFMMKLYHMVGGGTASTSNNTIHGKNKIITLVHFIQIYFNKCKKCIHK
jgi:hypothetical protein